MLTRDLFAVGDLVDYFYLSDNRLLSNHLQSAELISWISIVVMVVVVVTIINSMDCHDDDDDHNNNN